MPSNFLSEIKLDQTAVKQNYKNIFQRILKLNFKLVLTLCKNKDYESALYIIKYCYEPLREDLRGDDCLLISSEDNSNCTSVRISLSLLFSDCRLVQRPS